MGHCHTDKSNTNEENLCLHSKQRLRRKKAGTEEKNICGGSYCNAVLKVPEGWGLFTIERCKSRHLAPHCPHVQVMGHTIDRCIIGLTVDKNGLIYVSDYGNACIKWSYGKIGGKIDQKKRK